MTAPLEDSKNTGKPPIASATPRDWRTNKPLVPPKTGDVMELDEILDTITCLTREDAAYKTLKSKLTKYIEQVKKDTASEIFNLAHKYAQNDKTMIGSEKLRDYHYYNAIHKIGEFDGR